MSETVQERKERINQYTRLTREKFLSENPDLIKFEISTKPRKFRDLSNIGAEIIKFKSKNECITTEDLIHMTILRRHLISDILKVMNNDSKVIESISNETDHEFAYISIRNHLLYGLNLGVYSLTEVMQADTYIYDALCSFARAGLDVTEFSSRYNEMHCNHSSDLYHKFPIPSEWSINASNDEFVEFLKQVIGNKVTGYAISFNMLYLVMSEKTGKSWCKLIDITHQFPFYCLYAVQKHGYGFDIKIPSAENDLNWSFDCGGVPSNFKHRAAFISAIKSAYTCLMEL